MRNQIVITAIAASLVALVSAQQQSSNAQYPDVPVGGVTEEMLQRCAELGIAKPSCNENSLLLAERIENAKKGDGSGTSLLATETGQMVIIIGTLGAIFGGVAGTFYAMGRKREALTSPA
jgi:hypothetical protein